MVVFGDGKWSQSIANRARLLHCAMANGKSLGHEVHEGDEEHEGEAGAFNTEGTEGTEKER